MKKKTNYLSILGTGSDVGKSVVVTALCRIFSDAGVKVAPYKAQNLSNNSFVTIDGLEMGRAQIVQAQAARVEPTVEMNPVLLKPCRDTGAQIILNGKPIGNATGMPNTQGQELLFNKAQESLQRLSSEYVLIVMEGAGSCAEVNLRDRDFVNFKMAHAVEASVILVADIDRGGVFAQIIGTLQIISKEDRARVKGIIINHFRGDVEFFKDGIEYIQEQTKLPVVGVIPHFHHIDIDSEDGVAIDKLVDPQGTLDEEKFNIACLSLPHISNFTDLDPLTCYDNVNLHYLSRPRDITSYNLLILPGSKNVRNDMEWLRQTGWQELITKYKNAGGHVLGICGGYQILGKQINDPHGVEGSPGSTDGLGLLDIKTTLDKDKTTTRTVGNWLKLDQPEVKGYEIHMGQTEPIGDGMPVISVRARNGQLVNDTDGWQSEDGKIQGTYLHGVFEDFNFTAKFLKAIKPQVEIKNFNGTDCVSYDQYRQKQYDLLAEHFKKYLDIDTLEKIINPDTLLDV